MSANAMSDKRIIFDLENWLELPCHVYLKDKNGRYVECNAIQAESFGLKDERDAIGQSDKDFFVEKDATLLLKNDKEIVVYEKPKIVIEEVTFLRNCRKKMLSLKIPFRNVVGKLIGIFGASVEIPNGDETKAIAATPFLDIMQTGLVAPNNMNLTKRESECLYLLAKGLKTKEIARQIKLSPRTVEFYIDNMKKKLNCANRIELMAKALTFLKAAS